ncbi:hypothetical protein [Flexivirga alba]|uniref:DUF5666 domain-containing protein n=1 Tax=Flexivirga alba TaxID=702742 RepID=A0ABW2ACW2_9MICO
MLINKSFGAVLGAAGVLLLAGCGGGAATAVSSPAATGTGSASASGPGNGRSGFRQPGVSGVIASHTGSTATVNSTSGQSSTVTWTSSTPIVEQQPATAAAIVNGSCVSIRSAGTGFGGGRGGAGRLSAGASGVPTGARPSGARRSGNFTLPSKVTATAVTVQAASACGSSGSAAAGGGFGGFSGKVSKRSSGGFTLTVTVRDRAGGSSASPSKPAASSPKAVAVTTDSSTTYIKEVKGSAASLTAGECMTALGTQSGSALAARQIVVSQSVNGTCDSGFGGRGAGGTGATNG